MSKDDTRYTVALLGVTAVVVIVRYKCSWIYNYLYKWSLLPLNVVISNPVQVRCTWYNITLYVIKFVSGLQMGFSGLSHQSPRYTVPEIMLKVALSNIPNFSCSVLPSLCVDKYNRRWCSDILSVVDHYRRSCDRIVVGFYNYLYNQCISPLKLWVRTMFMARCTRYNLMW